VILHDIKSDTPDGQALTEEQLATIRVMCDGLQRFRDALIDAKTAGDVREAGRILDQVDDKLGGYNGR
jgi:hypothetical protein